MSDPTLAQVEAKLDELIQRHHRLMSAYQDLRHQQSLWQDEKKRLEEKNEAARSRIQNMIEKLRSLESDTE